MSLKAWAIQFALFFLLINGLELRYGLKFVDGATWQYWIGTAMISMFAVGIALQYDKEKK